MTPRKEEPLAKTHKGKKIVYVRRYTKEVNGQLVEVGPFFRSTPN